MRSVLFILILTAPYATWRLYLNTLTTVVRNAVGEIRVVSK